jgi:hypothetical protein
MPSPHPLSKGEGSRTRSLPKGKWYLSQQEREKKRRLDWRNRELGEVPDISGCSAR